MAGLRWITDLEPAAMPRLSHFDEEGASRMVDVGAKQVTARTARASARITMESETLARIRDGQVEKGDVLEVARLAGIMAAKRTSELIPLCHAIGVDGVEIAFGFPDETTISVEATAKTEAKTGVEMEALIAVSISALTIYDMCKGVDRRMTVGQVQLEEKSGGKSGHFVRSTD